MSDPMIRKHVQRLRRRVRLLLVERYSLFGAAAGVVVASILVLLSSRYDSLLDYNLWGIVVAGGIAAGCAFGLLVRLDDLTVAISADARTGLKERISTAVALGTHDDLAEVERAVVSDANGHIASLSARQVFRHRFGTPHIVFCSSAVLLAAVLIIPQTGLFQSRGRRVDVLVMKREGARMVKVAKDIRQGFGKKNGDMRKIAGKLDQLGKKMQTGRMDKKQAMLKTRKLTQEIKQQQDRLAKQNSTAKPMSEARAEMQKAGREIARQQAERIAKAEDIPPKEALEKVASDKRMAELARKDGALSQAEQQELEKAIEKYADPANQNSVPSELGEALAKLAENKDFQKAAELMQKLAQKLQTGKMSQMDKEALEKQLQMLAKALKNTDLDKLAKQLLADAEKLAKMSPEELQQLLKQIEEMQKMAKALEQAGGT